MKYQLKHDEIQIRVRYGETDQMGVVHHGNYPLYLEMGRTQLKKQPNVKIEFEYEITNQQGEIITEANVVLAFFDRKTNKPVRAPQYVLDAIEN